MQKKLGKFVCLIGQENNVLPICFYIPKKNPDKKFAFKWNIKKPENLQCRLSGKFVFDDTIVR